MKANKVLYIVILMAVILGLTGCSGRSKLLGKWESTAENRETLEFLRDGSLVVSSPSVGLGITGSYKVIDNSHIKVQMAGLFDFIGDQVLSYKVDKENLTIEWGGGVVGLYKKVE